MARLPIAVQRLAKAHKLTLKVALPPDDDYQYNANTRVIYAEDVGCLVHEIAHYLAATPRERARHNFHLGTGPDGGKGSGAVNYGQNREEEASLLGILIERELKLKLTKDKKYSRFKAGDPAYQYTWDYHNWTFDNDGAGITKTKQILARLQRHGLVKKLKNGKFQPTMKVRVA